MPLNHEGRQYYITDVFCEGNYSGNQLATLVDTEGLSSTEMQQIARAFNFAETTFICGGSYESGFDVRIFTPAEELPFAGHPTLGSAYLIREYLQSSTTRHLTLNLKAGKIPVRFEDDGHVWMQQQQPDFQPAPAVNTIATALGLKTADLDPDFSPELVSTGLMFLMVPVKSLEVLKRARLQAGNQPVFLFTREGYTSGHTVSARMFAPGLGISEDPATGSANGCLAAYAIKHGYFGHAPGSETSARVAQGYEVGRPSTLLIRADMQDDQYQIQVGGRVTLVAEGRWLV